MSVVTGYDKHWLNENYCTFNPGSRCFEVSNYRRIVRVVIADRKLAIPKLKTPDLLQTLVININGDPL